MGMLLFLKEFQTKCGFHNPGSGIDHLSVGIQKNMQNPPLSGVSFRRSFLPLSRSFRQRINFSPDKSDPPENQSKSPDRGHRSEERRVGKQSGAREITR